MQDDEFIEFDDEKASDRDLIWWEDGRLRHSYAKDLDLLFVRQKSAMMKIGMMVAASLDLVIMQWIDDPPDEDAVHKTQRYTRGVLDHASKYQKLPQRKDIPLVYRQLGSKIDRGMIQASGLLLKALEISELPKKLKIRRDFVEESERRRLARIEERRKKRAATPIEMAPPPVPADKREKEERPPPCSKCGKRPRVTGTLCEPCAKWMARR